MEPLSSAEIDAALAELGPAWRREGDSLVGELERQDFVQAIALVNEIAARAEHADHHPDILIHGYRRVTVTLSTHSAGAITERDVELARSIQAL
jgi:4a-hydroxytetrahydrobiopterin dehydratase